MSDRDTAIQVLTAAIREANLAYCETHGFNAPPDVLAEAAYDSLEIEPSGQTLKPLGPGVTSSQRVPTYRHRALEAEHE
jgi:hypothetical protein